jgi:hypothetical protein
MTPLARREDHNSEGMRHQEGPFSTKYGSIFLNHFYACINFGHKTIQYKINRRKNYMINGNDYGYPK